MSSSRPKKSKSSGKHTHVQHAGSADPAYGHTYGDPAYGNPAYGDPAYGNPAYGDPAYGGQAYGGTYDTPRAEPQPGPWTNVTGQSAFTAAGSPPQASVDEAAARFQALNVGEGGADYTISGAGPTPGHANYGSPQSYAPNYEYTGSHETYAYASVGDQGQAIQGTQPDGHFPDQPQDAALYQDQEGSRPHDYGRQHDPRSGQDPSQHTWQPPMEKGKGKSHDKSHGKYANSKPAGKDSGKGKAPDKKHPGKDKHGEKKGGDDRRRKKDDGKHRANTPPPRPDTTPTTPFYSSNVPEDAGPDALGGAEYGYQPAGGYSQPGANPPHDDVSYEQGYDDDPSFQTALEESRRSAYGSRPGESFTASTGYYERNPGNNRLPTSGQHQRNNTRNFDVHPSSKYRPGAVLKIFWSEPRGGRGRGEPVGSSVTESKGGGTENTFHDDFYTTHRRFIVVRTDKGHSSVVPIYTYLRQGCSKPGVKPDKHGIIYRDGHKPHMLPGEPRLGFNPVRMVITARGENLDEASRVNYSKISTIEHNANVYFIGHVDRKDFDHIVTPAVHKCFTSAQS